MSTGYSNLRKHLDAKHREEYRREIKAHGWKVNLSALSEHNSSTQNPRNIHNPAIPPFSASAFLEHLVNFIVADDQVSQNSLEIIIFTLTPFDSLYVSSNVSNSDNSVCCFEMI